MLSTDTIADAPIESALQVRLDVEHALHVIGQGRPVEIRPLKIPGRGKPHSATGYYTDYTLAAADVAEFDVIKRPGATYVVMNELNPARGARSPNRITEFAEDTTSDHDILRRRWLLVDCDPVRPAGISSTDEELNEARFRADAIYDHLREKFWPDCVVAESGNGMHLLYPIDMPNDAASLATITGILAALHAEFGAGSRFADRRQVAVDVKVANAARITKLYGTWTRKGFNTVDRPHRRSKLLYVPDFLDWKGAR